MAGFASYDELISETTTNGKVFEFAFQKIGTTMEGAGFMHSLARVAGTPPVMADAGASPGSACDNLAGCIFFSDVSPETKHLLSVSGVANQTGGLFIYDRLSHVGGISVASTGNKTVNSTALTRYTDGVGVRVYCEVTVATATTAPVVTLNSYTDEDGNTGQTGTSFNFPAAVTDASTLVGPLPLGTGVTDRGVRAVSTINVGTAGTAGTISVVLVKPLAYISCIANVPFAVDFVRQLASMPRIYDDASLNFAWHASSTTAVTVNGIMRVGYS